jgi:hypothetical protein
MPFLPSILYTRMGDRLRALHPWILAVVAVVAALVVTVALVVAFIILP